MENVATISREDWLIEAAKIIEKDILLAQQTSLPEKWTVSVGFPFGSAKAIGQAWDKEVSQDKETFNIFVSPELGEDIINTLQVLLHEMIHISVGLDQKHGGEFKRVARAVGLEGRLTATYAPEGSVLYAQLQSVLAQMEQAHGKYPHIPLKKKVRATKEREKNIKFVSPENPEYIVSIKESILEAHGAPYDPEGNEMIPVEGEE